MYQAFLARGVDLLVFIFTNNRQIGSDVAFVCLLDDSSDNTSASRGGDV